MAHSLLCPMQLRDNDVLLDECPKSKTENPTIDTHTIRAVNEFNQQVRIPLGLRGVTSNVIVSKPTLKQYNDLPHITLTSSDLLWDPHNTDYESAEAAFFDATGTFINPATTIKPNRGFIKFIRQMPSVQLSVNALNSLQVSNLKQHLQLEWS